MSNYFKSRVHLPSAENDVVDEAKTSQLPLDRNIHIYIDEIAAALRSELSVEDCAVLARTTDRNEQQFVAYIVPRGSFAPQRLQVHIQVSLPELPAPVTYVPVSSVPLTPMGRVDKAALAKLAVTDSTLVQRWEDKLRDLGEDIERLAVVVQERIEKTRTLHLSDLLPDWKETSIAEINEPVAMLVPPVANQQKSQVSAKAISHGEPLQQPDDSPTTLGETLQRAAARSPEKGIVYIQSDGSEILQSYPALLAEAQQILGGLTKLGLKPQDKVIFQLENNQDFIPAIWGCILGGFVPVPLAIAPTYSQSNGAVNKLHHVWELLEQPIVLTSQALAPAVSSLSDSLEIEDFRVQTIEQLRTCNADGNWHISQPDDLALLMLTSGSTGMPKGVMLSHRNLLSRTIGSVQMNEFSSLDITLNWMPLDHVAGLIYFQIRDVYLGCQQIHAPSQVIVKDPLKWLDWIDRFRVTVTFAPNFAYGLVNDRAEEISKRRWDLSSIRFVLNGAEAISAKTARRFLQLLAPHQLAATAMHPAWGMAETSSGVAYSNNFSLDSTTDDDLFVEVGTPIPGVSLRIVDDRDCIVREGIIGRLQVGGLTLTSGYYQNQKLNHEVFTEDGWFNTGDLGFLREGRLTITGRAKDVIIINGANYYSHDIEAVVEEVEAVEVSYTAACAIRKAGIDSEQLAIFFHTTVSESNRLTELLKNIRSKVIRHIGINPNYLIPVKKADIPKTSIGKIQRSQLSQRFLDGEFDRYLKQIDIATGNANTIPDWFYRPIWRPKAAIPTNQSLTGSTLLFLDKLGLGAYLSSELSKFDGFCIQVESGSDFTKLSPCHYQIDPKQIEHYRRLVSSVCEDSISIDRILHLWTYQEDVGAVSSLEELEQSQQQGVYSLLFLIQALSQLKIGDRPIQLQVISSYSQPTSATDKIAVEKSPVLGLLQTISHETPALNCRHIDLPIDRVEINGSCILQEMQTESGDREVAYRHGQRLIPRLEKVDLGSAPKQPLPFQVGGMYLLTGGLGGIGVEIAKHLLQTYQTKLLLLGRTPLPPRNTWETIDPEDPVARRIEAYRSLEQLGGEIFYEAVDICDLNAMQQVVEGAKSRWQCELDGVIHLAGVYQEGLLTSLTKDRLVATLRPKVFGTWVLHQLLKHRSNSVFVSFSSALSFFGGALVGAYAAANRFLDYFAHYQKYQCSLHGYCFNWTTWNDVGISQVFQGKEVLRAKGFYSMSVKQGLNSLLAGLYYNQVQLFVGLDGSKNHIWKHTETSLYPLQKLCAYFTSASKSISVEQLQGLDIRDRFGIPATCNFIQLERMPQNSDGTVNRSALLAPQGQRQKAPAMPQTEVEKAISRIWQDLLHLDTIDIHDNFFDLGGNSLLIAQVSKKMQDILNKDVSLLELFQYPTIKSLSLYLGQQSEALLATQYNQSTIRGENRREKLLRQRRRSSPKRPFV